jgi:oligopeptide transport system substrate-binding protein
MWRRTLGIEIKVVFLDPIHFTEAAREYPAHMTHTGWCADYPDPQNFFEPLFSTGAEFNDAGYTNPELDALLALANVEADRERRLDLYQQAEKLLLGDFALIPLNHAISEMLVKPRILGYTLAPMSVQFIYEIAIGADAP